MKNLYDLSVEENGEEKKSMGNMYNIASEPAKEEDIDIIEVTSEEQGEVIANTEPDLHVETPKAMFEPKVEPTPTTNTPYMGAPRSSRTEVRTSRKTKDSFVNSILNMYQPVEMKDFSIHNESRSYVVGAVALDKDNVHNVITEEIQNKFERVSFATDEFKLHNRIIDLGANRDKEEYVLLQSDLSDIIVRKSVRRNSINKDTVVAEIEELLSKGLQVKIDLLEEYSFTNENNLTFNRFRFRLALNEIKEVISHFKMQGFITEDSFLVLYE